MAINQKFLSKNEIPQKEKREKKKNGLIQLVCTVYLHIQHTKR